MDTNEARYKEALEAIVFMLCKYPEPSQRVILACAAEALRDEPPKPTAGDFQKALRIIRRFCEIAKIKRTEGETLSWAHQDILRVSTEFLRDYNETW